jgi:hypothetical protein
MADLLKGEGGGGEILFLARLSPPPPTKAVVIVHSLAVFVEQLCARGSEAPSIEQLRPKFCLLCGVPARNACGILQLVGHGMYSRQVRGLTETGWIVIWVRRFLCLSCGHTISCLPDWLHPWRWYAATVIVEALFRHCILQESSRQIGLRFGRPRDALSWGSLFRWRAQLLISPTLWGWLGRRLGIRKPACDRNQGKSYLHRLLAEGGQPIRSTVKHVKEVTVAVRRTLNGLVHGRNRAGVVGQFPPGAPSSLPPAGKRKRLPTKKGSGPDPP